MKNLPIKLSLILSLLMGAESALSHSALFPDNFVYDATNEGDKPGKPEALAEVACINGLAAGYPCNNVNFLSLVERSRLGPGNNLNDIWGWTDPGSLRRFAIVGQVDGTSFVEVTDGVNPRYLGFLRSHNNGSGSWRDIKVYRDHAFIVGDGSGNSSHGLQVFDLRQLLNVQNPRNFSETAHLDSFGRSHNIVINEESGFAYAVGSNLCSGGLVVVDISNPSSPRNVGCFSSDGYTHDAQCVNYQGPDSTYRGREICVAYNEDTLTIVDVSNKSNPIQISRTPYSGSNYTHQGWFLNDNHDIIIMNDELDEQRRGHNTKTRIFDVSNLNSPVLLGEYLGPTPAVDHNLYTFNNLIYESNYRAGLRILSSENIRDGLLEEVAFFDTIPGSNSAQFSGLWSSYIFPDGVVISSDIGTGLFVLRPTIDGSPAPAPTPTPQPIACEPGAINLDSTQNYSSSNTGEIFVDANGCTAYLSGNIWRITNQGFNIDANTVVQFDFATNGTGEIVGVGFDENTEASQDRIFQLGGSQADWGIGGFSYTGSGEFQSFSIPVGQSFTGNSLGFVIANDKDEGPQDNRVTVSNVVIRSVAPPTPTPIPTPTASPTPAPTATPTPNPIACVDGAISLNSTGDYSSESTGEIFVDANGCTAYLSGNIWQITTEGYTITENTVVEFDFATNGTGEIQGVGFDEDTEASQDRIFQLAGSQADWGITDFSYSGNGNFQSFSISVGQYFTGASMGFVLANDKDKGAADNTIAVSNVVIREVNVPTPTPTPTPVAPTPSPAPDGDFFFIVHKPTGAKMFSCSEEDLTPIGSRPNTNLGPCVQWRQIPNGDYFYLRNRVSDKNVKPDTAENGSPVSIVPSEWGGNWTQWRYVDRGDGFGHLENRGTGKYIHLDGRPNSLIFQQPSSWRGDFTRWQFQTAQ